MSRLRRAKKRKKKKIVISTILGIAIFLISGISYAAYGYYSSYKDAEKATGIKKEELDFKGDPFEGTMNVLLIGVDTRGEEASNSDSILLAQYDTKTKKAKLVSFLRDMYLNIPGKEKKYRINASYLMGGESLLTETLKQTFDIDIHYVAIVDFNGFIHAIDTAFPDGIEINVKKEMSEGIWQTLHPGVQRLNGKQLLGYSRFRKDAESDFGRTERQHEVLQAITDEIVSVKGMMKMPQMIGSVQPFITTNIKTGTLLSVLASFFSSDDHTIEKLRIPIDGAYENITLDDQWRSQVLDIDIEKNKEALHEFLNSEPVTE
ncbi:MULTISPECIES: LCP family protein [Bacillus]|uniref:LCP family protein n=1 Tax=Bacillus TaxID=1386 RepID=UPI0002D4CB2C|nr:MULTISPECIES: LCP family protein [Bacillus]